MSSVDQETKSSRWNWEVGQGDVMERLREMAPESVHCCVTSPPYWGLRKYGHWRMQTLWGDLAHFPESRRYRGELHLFWLRWRAAERGGVFCRWGCCWIGALGLEPTIGLYVSHMVEVFREVRRVLRKDGTVWLNLGDAYNAGTCAPRKRSADVNVGYWQNAGAMGDSRVLADGLKPKDLIGLPWRLAFALQADGWWLRSDIIWHKPNPMPESVTDRPTRAHEYVFLLSKSARYFYDADAIREPMAESSIARISQESFWEQTGGEKDHRNGVNPNRSARQSLENLAHKADRQRGHSRRHAGFNDRWDGMSKSEQQAMGANKRTVWSIASQPFPGAHFATFPEKLVEPCILAGTSERGVCGECLAPWERVVERNPEYDEWAKTQRFYGEGGKGSVPLKETTLGWQPSCSHDAEAVPAVVIDPFCGSGTTGVVALRHGRLFIGVELNPEYVELARRRIIGDAPLLNGNGRGGVKLLSESGPTDGESD